LNVDGVLGGEEVRTPVEVRAELNAVVSDFAERAEGEDLKASGVREDGARPTDEAMQAAHAADGFVAGEEIEMVCVAEDDFDAEGFERVLRDGFDGACGADGHEDWGFDGLVGQEKTAAAAAGGGCGVELVERSHPVILAGNERPGPRDRGNKGTSRRRVVCSCRLSGHSSQIPCCCPTTDGARALPFPVSRSGPA